ncbi:MAG: hypothetical protein LKI24_11025 [Acidipropionibacterium sp.]|nr:hypothetical protein [Acidipropionibacterium sp.]
MPSKRAFTVLFPCIFKDLLAPDLRNYRTASGGTPIPDTRQDEIVNAVTAQREALLDYVTILNLVKAAYRREFGHADKNNDAVFPLAREILTDSGRPQRNAEDDLASLTEWIDGRIAEYAAENLQSGGRTPFSKEALDGALADAVFVEDAEQRLKAAWHRRGVVPATSPSAFVWEVLRKLPVRSDGRWLDGAHVILEDLWDDLLETAEEASTGNWDNQAIGLALAGEQIRMPDLQGWSNNSDIPPLDLSIQQRCLILYSSDRSMTGSVAGVVHHVADASAAPLGVVTPMSMAVLVLGGYQVMDPGVVESPTRLTGTGNSLEIKELPGTVAMRRKYWNMTRNASTGPVTAKRRAREDNPIPTFMRKLWIRVAAGELSGTDLPKLQDVWELIIRAWSSWCVHTIRDSRGEITESTLPGNPPSTSQTGGKAQRKLDGPAVISNRLLDLLDGDHKGPAAIVLGEIVNQNSDIKELKARYQAVIRKAVERTGRADWPSYDDVLRTLAGKGRTDR